MNRGGDNDRLWSIVLAGGEGERLKPFVQRWLGRHKPKQYCTFIGTRSMFQHMLDWADQITVPEHKVTVIGRNHQVEAQAQFSPWEPGKVIVQPANRDTAAGVYLALTHFRAQDPQATVVLYPSDHFVYTEDRFIEVVRVPRRQQNSRRICYSCGESLPIGWNRSTAGFTRARIWVGLEDMR